MSILSKVKEWLNGMVRYNTEIKEQFGVKSITTQRMTDIVERCFQIYEGTPDWIDDDIHTINFAKTICSEISRLACMNVGITIDGSARAKWLQEEVDKVQKQLRRWVEYGNAYGTLYFKPNGKTIDVLTPAKTVVTDTIGDEIVGIVFVDTRFESDENRWYTRLEYHRLKNDKYTISNRCYWSEQKQALTHRIAIEKTPWKGLDEETTVNDVEHLLFGMFRTPNGNNIEPFSPLGLPIYADAVEELKDLDVAYSRNAKEIFDSKRTVIMDSDRLMTAGGKIGVQNQEALLKQRGLPDYVRLVEGTGTGDIYHEINPTLSTDIRLKGLDAYLSQIGYKCGFSNGYFVFDQKTGMVTATQVESDDRRTLQLINDVRDSIKTMLDGLIYSLDKFADLYDYAPAGDYEVNYDFEDLTLNEDEDRARWYNYVSAGLVPFERYLVMHEGFSEEEAKKLVQEADAQRMQRMAEMGAFNAEG